MKEGVPRGPGYELDSFEEVPDVERSVPRDFEAIEKDFLEAALEFAKKISLNRQISIQGENPDNTLVNSSKEFAKVRALGRQLPVGMRTHALEILKERYPDLPIEDLLPHTK